MIDKIDAMKEKAEYAMFRAHNPFASGIDGIDLIFAARTIFEIRQALEFSTPILTDTARSKIAEILIDAHTIRRLQRKTE